MINRRCSWWDGISGCEGGPNGCIFAFRITSLFCYEVYLGESIKCPFINGILIDIPMSLNRCGGKSCSQSIDLHYQSMHDVSGNFSFGLYSFPQLV
ncbi:hypothetical protein CEXT_412561 [Caerostris extrusa]|uniref:Uncharacterized protein n=1 Tax=Caerostris extrusa TaxID=172846 RepID=A0AAV4U891_CAEEX|nr:hypothetical protein CEXT_412561 [Caerostris extrusa]